MGLTISTPDPPTVHLDGHTAAVTQLGSLALLGPHNTSGSISWVSEARRWLFPGVLGPLTAGRVAGGQGQVSPPRRWPTFSHSGHRARGQDVNASPCPPGLSPGLPTDVLSRPSLCTPAG